MNYGEVSLADPDAWNGPGEAPLDLSEMDLLAPKEGRPVDISGPSTLEDPDLEIAQPAEPGSETAEKEAGGDGLKALAAAMKQKDSADRTTTGRLFGLPRRVAYLAMGGGALVLIVVLAVVFWPKKHPKKNGPSSTTNRSQTNGPPSGTNKNKTDHVNHAPAMDLDTHRGYLAADQAYKKLWKRSPGNLALKAARAKARYCDAYRFGVLKGLPTAKKLLASVGTKGGAEALKAKGMRALYQRKHKRARARFLEAKKRAAKDPEIYIFLGWTALDAGRLAEAEKAFRRAIKLRLESAAALFGLARSLRQSDAGGSVSEQKSLLTKALAVSKNHIAAQVSLLLLTSTAKTVTQSIDKLDALRSQSDELAPPRDKLLLSYGLGRLHLLAGNLDKALVHLAQATQGAATDPLLLSAEGRALLEAGDAELAAKRFAKALEQAPKNARILEGLVRALIASGSPGAADDAIVAFDKGPTTRRKRTQDGGVKKSPDPVKGLDAALPQSAYLVLAKGLVAQALGKLEKAENLFLETTTDAPRFTPGHVAHLSLLLARGKPENARTVLKLIKRKYSSLPAELQAIEGRIFTAKGQHQDAERTLRAALKLAPTSNAVQIELALCLMRHQKKSQEGLLLLEQVYRRAKSRSQVVILLADHHWKEGEQDRAIQRFQEALKVRGSIALKRHYAELLLRSPTQPRLIKAAALLAPLLTRNKRDHATIALLSLVELGRKQFKPALAYIRRALLIHRDSILYQIYLARILDASGDARRSEKIYTELLNKHPGDLRILLLRTRLYCRHADAKRCSAGARKILSISKSAEGHLLDGIAQTHLRRTGQALKAFRRALLREPRNARALFLLGRTLYNDNAHRKALSSLRRSLELADESTFWWPDVHYFLGMAYRQANSKRLAKKHLSRYLKTTGNPSNPETSAQRANAKAILKRL